MVFNPLLIAFFLPQFHRIKENDEFWGEGFTDWDNVKKAVPLYKNHRQPRVPLDNNYYNLLENQTLSWQINLAKEYCLDGFCLYHYWFNGKLLLEKPAENYLERNELDFPFCFSWANEPWTRAWDGKERAIIVNQHYNGEQDIIAHIRYLLPFFKDDRYIKIDGKPLFLIYRTNNIPYIKTMIEIWNLIARKNNLTGVYFCETLTGFQKEKFLKETDGLVYMEPMWIIGMKNKFEKLLSAKHSPIKLNRIENYDKIWNRLLTQENIDPQNFPGAFVDWDNSPRKKERNLVFNGSTPDKFEYYFKLQYEKAQRAHSPYIFINAWNEWAEGTYLEPDTYYTTKYLEVIKRIKLSL
jgi:hypothetical protein